jgi:hypothetical protein
MTGGRRFHPVVLAPLLFAALAPVRAQAPLVQREEWVVVLTLKGRTLAQDISVYVRDSALYLPLKPIAAAAMIPVEEDTATGVLSAEIYTKARTFSIYPRAGSVRVNGQPLNTRGSAMFTSDGELYLRADLFGPLMDVKATLDRSTSSVALTSDGLLPFEVRAAQERARTQSLEARHPLVAKDLADPYSLFRMPVADLSLTSSYARGPAAAGGYTAGYTAILAGEVAYMTGRMLVSGDNASGRREMRASFGRGDPAGQAFGIDGLTEAWVGDLSGQSIPLHGVAGAGRGLTISTFPMDRPDAFDQTTVEGDVAPGWQVELYQNDQLIAAQTSTPGGRYRFEAVPLLFGANIFRLVFYGPQGQQSEERRSVDIGANLVPLGKTRFRFSLAQEGAGLFQSLPEETSLNSASSAGDRLTSGMEVEHGLSRQVTVRAFGAYAPPTSLLLDGHRVLMGGGEIVTRVWGASQRAAVAVQATGGSALMLGGFGDLRGWSTSLEATHYSDFQAPLSFDAGRQLSLSSELRSSRSFSVLGLGSVQVMGDGEYLRFVDGGDQLRVDGILRHQLGSAFVGHGIFVSSSNVAGPSSQRALVSYAPSLSYWTGAVALQANALVSLNGPFAVRQTSLSGGYRVSSSAQVTARASYSAEEQLGLGAGYNHSLDQGIISLSTSWSVRERAVVSLGMTFSLAVKPSGALIVTRHQLAQDGAVIARVFQDANADGRFDAGQDQLLDKVRILVDGRAERGLASTEDGTVLLEGRTSGRAIVLGVDPTSLGDPFLIAEDAAIRVQVRPGGVRWLNVPVVMGGEVAGTVRVLDGVRSLAVAGVELELRDADGVVQRRVRTQSNGYYLIEQIAPGSYQLAPSARQQVDGVAVTAVSRKVVVGATGSVLDGVDFALRVAR